VGLRQGQRCPGITPSRGQLPVRHQPWHQQQLLCERDGGKVRRTRYLQAPARLATSAEKAIKLLPRCVGGHAQALSGVHLALPQGSCVAEKRRCITDCIAEIEKTLRYKGKIVPSKLSWK
jgi:hypothetical protein